MRRLLILAASAAVLAGCASWTPRPPATPPSAQAERAWAQRRDALAIIEQFVVHGRVASSAIGFRADLRWKQTADEHFEMRLAGPFGAGAAELSGSADYILVRSGQEPPQLARDPEAWLEQTLGVRLPVRGLRWWALGLPDPNAPFRLQLDEQGRVQLLNQHDWELAYLEYRPHDGIDLPRRIDARSGDTRVIVLADRWEALTPSPAQPSPAL